mgnify:CR=1 FL=1
MTGVRLSQSDDKWFWTCQICGGWIEGGFGGDSFRILRHRSLKRLTPEREP